MRTLTSTKFQLKRATKSMLIYYGIIFLIFGLIFLPTLIIMNYTEQDGSSNIEMSSTIFLFIVGLNSFKDDFRFSMANGISRKTFFTAGTLSLLSLAGIMSIIDTVFAIIATTVLKGYEATFEITYHLSYGSIITMLQGFLWTFALNAFLVLLGYFITISYYRMNKALKIGVSIGVPVTFLMLLPLIDSKIGGIIYQAIGDFFLFVFGLYKTVNPNIAIMCFLIGTMLVAGLSYLLVQRAPLKE